MGKYKVGQVLRVKEGCSGACGTFEDGNAEYIKITNTNHMHYTYDILDSDKNVVDDCWHCFKDSHLEPCERKLKNAVVGDVVVSGHGSEAFVLEVGENSFLISNFNNFDIADDWFTFKEAENDGLKLKEIKSIRDVKIGDYVNIDHKHLVVVKNEIEDVGENGFVADGVYHTFKYAEKNKIELI